MGTKAGAEKARERRAQLAAERERQGIVEQPAQQPSALTTVDAAALISADRPTDDRPTDVLLARQMLTASAPLAADVLNRIVAGRIRAPAAVRSQAAIRTLEMAGVPVDQKRPGAAGELGDGLGRLLDAFTRVKELRDRKAVAETVAPIAPTGAVEPPA